jgi:cytochrome c553
MKTKWLIIAATAALFSLAGAAQAANMASCAGCHGANGEGKGNNPKIAGHSKSDLIGDLKAYRSGAKKHAAMNAVTKNLSDADIEAMAAFYSSK